MVKKIPSIMANIKEQLDQLYKVVTDYLKINPDLFFCEKNNKRIIEARKYFSYLAYNHLRLPPSKIAGYLSVSEKRSSIVIDSANSVSKTLRFNNAGQATQDIRNILNKLNVTGSDAGK